MTNGFDEMILNMTDVYKRHVHSDKRRSNAERHGYRGTYEKNADGKIGFDN